MIGTRTKLAAAVGIVAAAAILVLPRARHKPSPPSAPSSAPAGHGASIDHQFASYFALYDAPEGATPCESAFNAFQHSIDVAAREHLKPIVISVAPHDEFVARCAMVPSAQQACLVPRYRRDHDAECKSNRPPDDVLRELQTLVQLQPAVVKLDGPPGSAPSASASP
jgi:hypothetical protein